MRKHFLLLFLMALLPLAGWAQPDYVEVTITPFDQSVTWFGGKPEVTKAWFQSPGATNPALKDAIATLLEIQDLEGDYKVDEYTYKLKLKNPAQNTVYQYADGITTSESNTLGVLNKVYTIYTSSATATLNITKATAEISLNQLAYVGNDLVYTSEAQDLLTIGDAPGAQAATATANGVPVPVVYALSETAETWVSDYSTLKGTNAGTYQVYCKVVPTDNYVGVLQSLGEKSIAKAVVTANVEEAGGTLGLVYDGNPIALLTKTVGANPAFNFGESTLEYKVWTGDTEPTDWTATTTGLAAVTAKNAGAYKVKLKVPATANYYSGVELEPDLIREYHVIIGRAEVDEESASVALANQDQTFTYKGEAWEPALTVSYGGNALTADNGDIAIAYANNTNAGEATATVTFNNYYKDDVNVAYTKDLPFTIAQKSLADEGVTASVISTQLNQTYKGSAFTGSTFAYANLNVYVGDTKLTSASYDRSYQNNINVGSKDDPDETKRPAVIITGKGNYTGVTKAYFNILPRSLEDANIAISADLETAQTYTGSQITPSTEGMITYSTPDPDYTLVENTDYTVAYGENKSGTGTITITGTGNFGGSVVKEFVIGNATAYIVPVAKSKLYGAAEPTLTWKVEDADGNTLDNNVLKGTVTLARQDGEDVGSYLIYVVSYTPGAGDNYTVANVMGDTGTKTAPFTIFANTENPLVLKFKDDLDDAKKTKVYDGTTDVAFTAGDFEAVSGLLGGDEWETIGAGATIAAELSSADVNAENNQVTATVTGLANYPTVVVQDPLAFTITKRPVKFTAINKTDLAYSDKDAWIATLAVNDTYIEQTINDDYLALVTGDEMSELIQSITAESQNVGDNVLKLTAKTEGKIANYNVTLVDGTLTIGAPAAGGAIALGAGGNDLQTIKDYDGQNVNVSINFTARNARELPAGTARTWTADTWVTLTLPFNISVADLSKALGYAIVNVIDPSRTEINSTSSKFYGKLTMKGGNGDGTEDYLVANKPFLVKTADAINGAIDFGTQTIVAPTDLSVEAGGGAKFTGTYATKNVTSADNAAIWFMIGGNRQSWAYITTTSSAAWDILPFEGFIDMSSLPAQARSNMTFYFEEIDGSTTAIKSINADDLNSKIAAEGMYNMNGMKLNTVPTQKGIYILNGKKVVIK